MLSVACRYALAASVFAVSIYLSAQNSPATGEITVELVQGLDSAANSNGVSQGRVRKSTNPAVPAGSAALLAVVPDPGRGGYTVKLTQLGIRGQVVRADSSDVALAPDFMNKMLERTRAAGQPQDAVSGARVFLPERMLVRFTLAAPPVEANSSAEPSHAQTAVSRPAAQPVWRMLPPGTSDPNTDVHSAAIAGTAEAGGRRGTALLTIGCSTSRYPNDPEVHANLPVTLRVTASMTAFLSKPEYGDFTCEGDGAIGSPSVYTEVGSHSVASRSACFDGEKPTNPAAPVELGLVYEDAVVKQIVDAQGGVLLVHFRGKAAGPDDLVARFALPDQAAALQQMIAPCLDVLAAKHKKEQDSIVVECPAVEGSTLSEVQVLTGYGLKNLEADGDNDIGTVWKLPRVTKAHPVRPKLTLACSYTNRVGAADKKMLPIPAEAKDCLSRLEDFTNVPYGRCTR